MGYRDGNADDRYLDSWYDSPSVYNQKKSKGMAYNSRMQRNFGSNNLPSWAKYILIPLGIVVAYKIYLMIKNANETGKAIAGNIKDSVQVAAISNAINGAGISDKVRVSFIQDCVNNIYAAFYKDSFWGMAEDEEKAVSNFNEFDSVAEAKAGAGIYRAMFKKSLYDDMVKYCNGSDFAAIKQTLLNAVKGI